jgi:hypothetical protein
MKSRLQIIFLTLALTLVACAPKTLAATTPKTTQSFDFTPIVDSIKLYGPDSGCIKTFPQVNFGSTTTNAPKWDSSVNPTLVSFDIYPEIAVAMDNRNFTVTFGNFPQFFYIAETVKTAGNNTYVTKEFTDTTLYPVIVGKALSATNNAYGYTATWKIEINEKGSHYEPISCLPIYE